MICQKYKCGITSEEFLQLVYQHQQGKKTVNVKWKIIQTGMPRRKGAKENRDPRLVGWHQMF